MRLQSDDYFCDSRAQVAIGRMHFQQDVALHSHEFMEIVVILAGRATHLIDGVRHPIEAGDVLVVHSFREHAYESTRKLSLVNLFIREDLFQEVKEELVLLDGYQSFFSVPPRNLRAGRFTNRLRLGVENLDQLIEWMEALEEESGKPAKGGRLLSRSWLLLILGFLSRHYRAETGLLSDRRKDLPGVIAWMERHFSETLSIRELARKAGMSERTFLRRFREAAGCSPIEYLIRTRLRKAGELLADEGLSITEVAFRCGFQDSNYFARQFRKYRGTTPRSFRAG